MADKRQIPKTQAQWDALAATAWDSIYDEDPYENARARYEELIVETGSDRNARAQMKREGSLKYLNARKRTRTQAAMAHSSSVDEDDSDEESDEGSDEDSEEDSEDDSDYMSDDDDGTSYTSQGEDEADSSTTDPMEEPEPMPHAPIPVTAEDLEAVGAGHLVPVRAPLQRTPTVVLQRSPSPPRRRQYLIKRPIQPEDDSSDDEGALVFVPVVNNPNLFAPRAKRSNIDPGAPEMRQVAPTLGTKRRKVMAGKSAAGLIAPAGDQEHIPFRMSDSRRAVAVPDQEAGALALVPARPRRVRNPDLDVNVVGNRLLVGGVREPEMQAAPHAPIAVSPEDLVEAGVAEPPPHPLAPHPFVVSEEDLQRQAEHNADRVRTRKFNHLLGLVIKKYPSVPRDVIMEAWEEEHQRFNPGYLDEFVKRQREADKELKRRQKWAAAEKAAREAGAEPFPKQIAKRSLELEQPARKKKRVKDVPEWRKRAWAQQERARSVAGNQPDPIVEEPPDIGMEIVPVPVRPGIPQVEPRAAAPPPAPIHPDAPRPEQAAPIDPNTPSLRYEEEGIVVNYRKNRTYVISGETLISCWNPDSNINAEFLFPDDSSRALRKLFKIFLWDEPETFLKWQRQLSNLFKARAHNSGLSFYTKLLAIADDLVTYLEKMMNSVQRRIDKGEGGAKKYLNFFADRHFLFVRLLPALQSAKEKYTPPPRAAAPPPQAAAPPPVRQKKPRPAPRATPDSDMADSDDDRDEPRIEVSVPWKYQPVMMLLVSFLYSWNPGPTSSRVFTTDDSKRLRRTVGELFWAPENATHFAQFSAAIQEAFTGKKTPQEKAQIILDIVTRMKEFCSYQYQAYRKLTAGRDNLSDAEIHGLDYFAAREQFLLPMLNTLNKLFDIGSGPAVSAPSRPPPVSGVSPPSTEKINTEPSLPPGTVPGPDGSIDVHPPVDMHLYYMLWFVPFVPLPDTPAWYKDIWQDVQNWKKTHPSETFMIDTGFHAFMAGKPLNTAQHQRLIKTLEDLFTGLNNALVKRREIAMNHERQLAEMEARKRELLAASASQQTVAGLMQAQARDREELERARQAAYLAEQRELAARSFLAGVMHSGFASAPVNNTQINVGQIHHYHGDARMVPIPMEVDNVVVTMESGRLTAEDAVVVVEEAEAVQHAGEQIVEILKEDQKELIAETRTTLQLIGDLEAEILALADREIQINTLFLNGVETEAENDALTDEHRHVRAQMKQKKIEYHAAVQQLRKEAEPQIVANEKIIDAVETMNAELGKAIHKSQEKLEIVERQIAGSAPGDLKFHGPGSSERKKALAAAHREKNNKKRAQSVSGLYIKTQTAKSVLTAAIEAETGLKASVVLPPASKGKLREASWQPIWMRAKLRNEESLRVAQERDAYKKEKGRVLLGAARQMAAAPKVGPPAIAERIQAAVEAEAARPGAAYGVPVASADDVIVADDVPVEVYGPGRGPDDVLGRGADPRVELVDHHVADDGDPGSGILAPAGGALEELYQGLPRELFDRIHPDLMRKSAGAYPLLPGGLPPAYASDPALRFGYRGQEDAPPAYEEPAPPVYARAAPAPPPAEEEEPAPPVPPRAAVDPESEESSSSSANVARPAEASESSTSSSESSMIRPDLSGPRPPPRPPPAAPEKDPNNPWGFSKHWMYPKYKQTSAPEYDLAEYNPAIYHPKIKGELYLINTRLYKAGLPAHLKELEEWREYEKERYAAWKVWKAHIEKPPEEEVLSPDEEDPDSDLLTSDDESTLWERADPHLSTADDAGGSSNDAEPPGNPFFNDAFFAAADEVMQELSEAENQDLVDFVLEQRLAKLKGPASKKPLFPPVRLDAELPERRVLGPIPPDESGNFKHYVMAPHLPGPEPLPKPSPLRPPRPVGPPVPAKPVRPPALPPKPSMAVSEEPSFVDAPPPWSPPVKKKKHCLKHPKCKYHDIDHPNCKKHKHHHHHSHHVVTSSPKVPGIPTPPPVDYYSSSSSSYEDSSSSSDDDCEYFNNEIILLGQKQENIIN